MLNKGRAERKKSENGKFRKNMVLYLLLIAMLVFSFCVYQKGKNESVTVGSFGASQKKTNISFSDLLS